MSTEPSTEGWFTRWAVTRDLPYMLLAEVTKEEHHREPRYNEGELRGLMRATNTASLVLDAGQGRVIGHLVYSWDGFGFHVVTLAVNGSNRRRGVGTWLMKTLKAKTSKKRPMVYAAVSEYNLPAQLFLRSNGFQWRETLHTASGESYCFSFTGAKLEIRGNSDL